MTGKCMKSDVCSSVLAETGFKAVLVFGIQIFTVNTENVLYNLLFGASSEDKCEASREYITKTYLYNFDPL